MRYSEFRKYGKLNCTIFDLISGDLEPKQTMALGFLLSRSEIALNAFLKLIKCGVKYDKVIVDCEAQRKQNNNNDRIDILLRFYLKGNPQRALIIEAKSARANTSAQAAATQASKYTYGFSQLVGFTACIETISLTREVKEITKTISISWSELISALFNVSSKDKLIKEFLDFFLNIKGSMKYYDEEILSIPAGMTYNAVMASGIYECPNDYKKQKRSIFITFRKNKGLMDRLFKLTDVVELDIDDQIAIATVDNSLPGFAARLQIYRQTLKKPVSGHKRVYILDLDNPILLPVPVRPIENNAPPVYYNLHEFFSVVNSNINCVIVQKDIDIQHNTIRIQTKGNKTYELQDGTGSSLKVFSTTGCYSPLQQNETYKILVRGTKRNVALKRIMLKYINNQWTAYYEF